MNDIFSTFNLTSLQKNISEYLCLAY